MSAVGSSSFHIDLPVPGSSKDIIERAAQIAGQTVGEFAATALVEKAEEVLRGPVARPLSVSDARRFLELLDQPPAAADALKAAARRFPPSDG
jgi:uncharacterized protein (DUF1778 family)